VAKLELRGSIWKEGDAFVSRCDSLNIMSGGETFEQAWANTIDAIQLFIHSCIVDGTMHELTKRLAATEAAATPLEANLTFEADPLQGATVSKSVQLS
jgi:predicted RNase H-like HicB family nuclease